MFILKWVNFIGYSFNLNCDKEFVQIILTWHEVCYCHIDVYVQCLLMYFFDMKVIISVEIIFSLSIDSLIVWKFRFLIRINGILPYYKEFRT